MKTLEGRFIVDAEERIAIEEHLDFLVPAVLRKKRQVEALTYLLDLAIKDESDDFSAINQSI